LNQTKSQLAAAQQQTALLSTPVYSPTPSLVVNVYPTHNIIQAKAMEASSQAALQASIAHVQQLTADIRKQFEATPDYMQANGNLDTCRANFDSARKAVLANL
jgi:hypothetical protein